MTAIHLGLHLNPPPRQRLDAFVETVKRETGTDLQTCEMMP